MAAALLPGAGCAAGLASPVGTKAQEMQTFCFGRHQMALPLHFEEMAATTAIFTPPGLTEADAPIDVTVMSGHLDLAGFQAAVDKRQAALRSASRKTRNILKEVIPLGSEATLFRILVIDDAYRDELLFRKGGRLIVAKSASYEHSYKRAEARLGDFMARVEPAASSTGPSSFCLGSVAVKGNYAGEYASYGFRSKEMKDMIVSLTLNTFAPDERADLLKRSGGEDSLLRKSRARHKVLRQGEIKVSGMRAQEWLSTVQLGENGDEKHYLFSMETMRPAPSQMLPRLHMRLDTGQNGDNGEQYRSSLDERAAIALWDGIIASIRPRP